MQAQNFQIIIVLPSKILMYYCLAERSKPNISISIVSLSQTKAGHKIVIALFLISQILMYFFVGNKASQKFQIVLVLPSQIRIYYCVVKVRKASKKNFK